jgi:hypothetical protein
MMPSQRTLGTLVLLLIIALCVAIPAFAFKNEPDEFRGIKWGTNIGQLTDMVLSGDSGEEKFYLRKNDKMQIGDATLDTLEYAFYKERFFAVFIKFKGDTNSDSLWDTLSYVYGKSDGKGLEVGSFYWEGTTVKLWFRHNYTVHGRALEGEIIYFYKPICNEKTDSKKRSGAGDL